MDNRGIRRENSEMSIYDFSANLMSGDSQRLDAYRGQVLVMVNTASQCSFTPHFEGLEALHQKYGQRGFRVLGFPCNQFKGQDPGSNQEILDYCMTEYGVSFPMFEKLKVNGPDAHPLFVFLKKEAPGLMGTEKIKWNFTKFLVDSEGKVVGRFASTTRPASMTKHIEKLLVPKS